MIDQSQVTVIIPHLGANEAQRYALEQCLTSLQETTPDIKKVIAVNGGEYDKGFYMNYRGFNILNNVEIIELTRQGQCGAVNTAVATVSTPWVLVTNDDMVYPPGWFEKLVEPVEASFVCKSTTMDYAPILCISPQLVEPTPGAPTFLTCFCGGAGGDFNKDKFIEFVDQYRQLGVETVRPGFNLPFLINKELWDLVSGYDVNYDPWGSNSDSDLEYKIKLAGVQPYQNTNCLVYHFSQTSGTFSPEHQDAWQKNWQYFIDKWGFPRAESPEIWTAEFEIPQENKFHPFWEGHYK